MAASLSPCLCHVHYGKSHLKRAIKCKCRQTATSPCNSSSENQTHPELDESLLEKISIHLYSSHLSRRIHASVFCLTGWCSNYWHSHVAHWLAPLFARVTQWTLLYLVLIFRWLTSLPSSRLLTCMHFSFSSKSYLFCLHWFPNMISLWIISKFEDTEVQQ